MQPASDNASKPRAKECALVKVSSWARISALPRVPEDLGVAAYLPGIDRRAQNNDVTLLDRLQRPDPYHPA